MNAQGAAKYGVRLMVVLALLCAARTAGAQAQDEFFDDSTVHELRLTLNSKDWSALKQNFKENIYYPTALQWRGVNVSNVGIRSRGLGSRSGTKPGLRVDMDRYNAEPDLPRPEVLRPRQPGPGSLDAARAAGDGLLPPPRPAGAARGARAAVRQRHLRRALRDRRDHRQGLPRALLRRGRPWGHRERRLPVRVRLHARVPLREPRLELRRLQDLRAQDPRERRLGEDLGTDRRHGQGDQRHARRDLRTRAVHVSGSDEVRQSHRHREPSWRKTTASWATPG